MSERERIGLTHLMKALEDTDQGTLQEMENMGLAGGPQQEVLKDPNVVQLLELFRQQPVLRRACLLWAQDALVHMNTAMLESLYSPQQLQEMAARASGGDNSGQTG